ncbi:hypothetical protein JD77_06071 [Micromonospora olivasterospora]|uniref:Uncharacterized protein n=1 Tax=Micromonospora olivasterospora TaxID=1880 RepID=A0A562IJP2_MICOL|nr:hypothetical protein JD77_06071 [Micromonospora olivasterospora]
MLARPVPVGHALHKDAAEDPNVLCCARASTARFAVKKPVARFSVAGCRIGGMPFVVGWKAVIGTARN